MKTIDESLEQLIRIAIDCIHEGNCDQGKRLLESGLYDEPGYAKLHSTLAWMYQYFQENVEMAIRHYELAIYFDREYEYAYTNLAFLYFNEKRYDEATDVLVRALATESVDKSFVHEKLGTIAEKRGNYHDALTHYRRALLVCLDNEEITELKQNIKRTRFKRFKKRIGKWQQ